MLIFFSSFYLITSVGKCASDQYRKGKVALPPWIRMSKSSRKILQSRSDISSSDLSDLVYLYVGCVGVLG